MKTAEEWIDIREKELGDDVLSAPSEQDYVERIQLDAFKAGMRRAAEIASVWMQSNRLHPDIPNDELNESAKIAAHSVLQQASLTILAAANKITKEKM